MRAVRLFAVVPAGLLVSALAAHAQYTSCPPAPPPPALPPSGADPASPGNGAPGLPGGDATSPGPSAPSSPGPGSPGPGDFPGPGSPGSGPAAPPGAGAGPSSPGPGAPSAPGPSGGGRGGGAAAPSPASGVPGGGTSSAASALLSGEDTLHWKHWWFLESAAYLDLRARIQGPLTPDGRSVATSAPRAPSRRAVALEVVPRLIELARSHRDDDVVASALLALGRLADAGLETDIDPATPSLAAAAEILASRLAAQNSAVAESAALALGLLGEPELAASLVHLVRDDADGRQLVGGGRVATRLRCFAAFGLGLAAQRIDDPEVRQWLALELAETLAEPASRQDELEVALLTAFGLCELPERPLVPRADLRQRAGVERVLSRSTQLRFLDAWVRPTRADGRRSTVVRAHALTAAARLADDCADPLRTATSTQLSDIAENRAESIDVRAAAALALGSTTRGGSHPIDRASRRTLLELVRQGQPIERRMALIGVAQAASQAGAGDDSFEGHSEVRRTLASELARGHSHDRPWIALALGALDEGLHAAGVDAGGTTFDVLQETALKRRGADDTAALALAMALSSRGTKFAAKAGERLERAVETTDDPDARGHLFLAAGLLEHYGLRPVLRKEVREQSAQPVRLWSAAVGLALLGDPVSRELVPRLQEARSSGTQIALAAAIGHTTGAEALAPLVALLDDPQATSATKAAAVDALGALCDLERLPWRHALAHGLPYFVLTSAFVGGGTGVLELPW